MTITKTAENSTLTVKIEGRIDSVTAPQLSDELTASLAGVTMLILDFKEVGYISSAGLRVLLAAQKTMNTQGAMELHNVNDALMDIFAVTGFSSILTIK